MISAHGNWQALFSSGSCKLYKTSCKATGQYVALSYCWGKSLAYTTTTGNLKIHTQHGGIPFSQLPKTLQDAIFMVRYLNIGHLWADCLCIIQDDKADWEYEAAQMADVYSNAYLTIAATRATHCGEGFLQPRKVSDGDKVQFEDAQGHFQERVLAVRTLHFATNQMYWECAHSFEEENGIVRASDTDFYKEYSLESLAKDQDAWERMVQEYTSREMTYQSDKFPALSGVISALQKITGDTCYAGIWRSWFLLGLLWRIQHPDRDIYVFAPKQPRSVGFWRAPSWSFGALEGVVLYDILQRASRAWDFCSQLEHCNVVPSGSNPLGELKSGYASIRGPLTVISDTDQEIFGNTTNGKACKVHLSGHRYVYGGVYFDLEDYETCNILMITPYDGLALRPVNATTNTYVRVGAVWAFINMGIIHESGAKQSFAVHESPLSAADYPEPTLITLL
ncbi:HET-domain-containing protein [Ophiobolus disseminans]|uniref:HET-domain-containing protein n=1 Tax=Ophiobolus disseminans TaxID=1469910 RepID=A0A6A6ZWZ9_9PLEO|nr:HET-domain-containing protein [Ophiobolus disseminans]